MTTSAAKSRNRKGRSTPAVKAKPKPVAVGVAVFLEHESGYMEPVLLRRCINEWEGIGWRDGWYVDNGILDAKLVVRDIDADGNAIDDDDQSEPLAALCRQKRPA